MPSEKFSDGLFKPISCYSYSVNGIARSIKFNPTDTRSISQRFRDNYSNLGSNFSDRANEANKKMFGHNPNLDRWGNAMEFINGVAAGAVNPFLSAGEAVGLGDALYGTGYAIDKATMYGIAPLSADGKLSAIGGLGKLGGVEKDIGNAVRDWSAENPNAAETVEAVFNVAAVTKAAKLAKTGAGKSSVSDDFSRAYTCSFHGSTLVKTNNGYKAIADIRVGDSVFAKDEKSGQTGYKTVTAQYANPYQEAVYVGISDGIKAQTLIANRIHPFFADGKWIQAGRLKAGDRLLSENGQTQTVQSVTIKRKPLKAYNLTVADWHTYFVKGDKAETGGVWVHNACPPRKSSGPVYQNDAEASRAAKELGYKKIKERTRNDAAIFKKGNSYISRDVDGHNGGAWKEASSPKKLNSKNTRNGTFDKNLNRIGD